MEMFKFTFKVQHDKGVSRIKLTASSIFAALDMITTIEAMPARAIVGIQITNIKLRTTALTVKSDIN